MCCQLAMSCVSVRLCHTKQWCQAVVSADKHERMKAAAKYYFQGDASDLMRFPGGSEPGT